MGIMDKMKEALQKNPSKSRGGAHKGADTADEKTGGRHAKQTHAGEEELDHKLGEERRRHE